MDGSAFRLGLRKENVMIGAIAGDIIGSVYEWNNIKAKDFVLFSEQYFLRMTQF